MSWYVAGTVSVTEGNNLVSGTGTDFVNNVRAGDSFQGPDGRQYQITNVISALQISILPAYQSESLSDQSYAIIPSFAWAKEAVDKLSHVVDQFGTLAANTNNEWVSASTPAAALEALGAFVNLVTAADDESARTVLGLGAAATLGVATATQSASGSATNVLNTPAGLKAALDQFGLFGTPYEINPSGGATQSDIDSLPYGIVKFSSGIPANSGSLAYSYVGLKIRTSSEGSYRLFCYTTAGSSRYTAMYDTAAGSWVLYWHNSNTTVDSSGFIKKASPIVNLYADRVVANNYTESKDVQLVINGTGDYTLTNTTGFADDGWYIETFEDANGNKKVFVEYSQTHKADGSFDINIKTYTPDYSTGPATAGDPIDITEGRFIAIRLNEIPIAES